MPFWLGLGLGLLGLFQQQQQAQAQQRAMQMAEQGGLSDVELADLERRGRAGLKTTLSRRGLLDSGLLSAGEAAIPGELALAKAKGRGALQGTYLQALLSQSQQPSLVGSLVPLFLQYGLQRPGGGYYIPPYTLGSSGQVGAGPKGYR